LYNPRCSGNNPERLRFECEIATGRKPKRKELSNDIDEAHRLVDDLDPCRLRIALRLLRFLADRRYEDQSTSLPQDVGSTTNMQSSTARSAVDPLIEEDRQDTSELDLIDLILAAIDERIADFESTYESAKVKTAIAIADKLRIQEQLKDLNEPSRKQKQRPSRHQIGPRQLTEDRLEEITPEAFHRISKKADGLRMQLSSLNTALDRLRVMRKRIEFQIRRIRIESVILDSIANSLVLLSLFDIVTELSSVSQQVIY
jgi:hypothetical protein